VYRVEFFNLDFLNMRSSRRNFLKSTGLAIGGSLVLPACYYEPAPFRFFTQEEANCLVAVCERIIPADDAPGATDAGVIYYIDKQLTGPFQKFQQSYRAGIKAFQTDCMDIYGKGFEKLSAEQQIEFLELLEEDDDSLNNWTMIQPSEFFNIVINHTMQGFYGAPRHGGNKDYMSYRMIGIGYPQVVGQNRYGKGDPNG
jgi:gluconate 2-dehydrogenase gamma chain